jgi:cytochrome c biogenesis factor
VGVNLKNFSIEVTWNNSLIDGIKFSEKESQEVKEYRFYYKTIYYANTNDRFNDVGKPFLLHVKEVNSATCTAFPSFVFSYVAGFEVWECPC